MIKAICGACRHVFWAAVVMGITKCPHCHSKDTYVAIEVKND